MSGTNTGSQLKFAFADIVIHVKSMQPYVKLVVHPPHDRFLIKDGVPECTIRVSYGSIPKLGEMRKVFDSGGNWMLLYGNGKYVLSLTSPVTGPEPYRLAIFDSDFREGVLYIRPYRPDMPPADVASEQGVAVEPFEYPLDELLVVNLLARDRGLNVHGCAVADKRGGLVFCGVSGAGKSTIAELWKKRPVEILSDDRLILRNQKGVFYVHGTPWHGDARVALPHKARLNALYFIKHAPANRIVALDPVDASTRLLVRCFPTFYYPEGMGYTLRFVSQLTREVPCFELGFVPDQSVIDHVLSHTSAFASGCGDVAGRGAFFDGVTREILDRGSALRFKVNGNSMAPLVRDGDVIKVEPVSADRLRIGDIVFYRRPEGRHVVHRLVAFNGTGGTASLTTKGDNMRHADAPVAPGWVLGRTVLIESGDRELPLNGRTARLLTRLLLRFGRGDGYVQDKVRRLLSKSCWFVVGRKKR